MHFPAVSVIIPAFHAEAFISRSVKSLLAQTMTRWEAIIIADDGKDYNGILAMQGITDARLRFGSSGGVGTGAARTRNKGLSLARADIIATLDADDAFTPTKLSALLPHAQSHGVAFSNISLVRSETGALLPNHNKPTSSGLLSLQDMWGVTLHTNTVLLFDRRRIKSLWCEEIGRWEDFLFLLSCFDHVDHAYYLDAPLHIYYQREGSLCNQEGAAQAFIHDAEHIIALMSSENHLIVKPSVRQFIADYLSNQIRLERQFIDGMESGEYGDFQEFIAINLQQFYSR